jgi:ribosome-binding ATPase YchF (GTP1/OBG family)
VKKHNKDAIKEKEVLESIVKVLEDGKFAGTVETHKDDKKYIKDLHLLTAKPMLYVLNKKAGGNNLDEIKDERWDKLMDFFKENKYNWVVVDANIEDELNELEGGDREEYRKELRVHDDGVKSLIKESYDMLGLITYLTTGPKESRAWTVKKGSDAATAGGVIHSDFKDKFIKADVIHYDDLVEIGSIAKARESGMVRSEGREYVVCDGDVIEFKI